MQLTLDRIDLKPKYQKRNCSQIKFEHFCEQAQRAIRVVGRAVFQEYDKSNYNTIYLTADPLTRNNVTFEELERGYTAHEPDQTYGAAD